MLYDAHNHLHDAWLAPHHEGIHADLARLPLGAAVVNGTCETDWPDVTALASAHPWVRPSYGLHPWHVGQASPGWRDHLQRILDSQPSAALGEIGLDRWILERARPDDPRLAGLRRAPLAEQVEALVWQLALATARNLPVTLHCLDAWGPLLEVLRSQPLPKRGFLLHAYGGSADLAREFVGMGAYFSFNGAFLDPRHAAKQATFAALPADRLLVETDAPAMPPPAAHRPYALPPLPDGTIVNHPANLTAAYSGLADLRRISPATLTAQIAENFRRFFG